MTTFVRSYFDLLTGKRPPQARTVISPGFEKIVAERIRKGELTP